MRCIILIFHTLKDVVISSFQILIPISILYGFFMYTISRDHKEMNQAKLKNEVKPTLDVIQQEVIVETIVLEPSIQKDYSHLKYARRPLHNKFKNKSETIKLKHKRRSDTRLNFRG